MPDTLPPADRLRRALWAIVVFLLGFAVLVTVVIGYYLEPAADAARFADDSGRRQLSAFSTLLLAIVLFTLLVGLAMVFRIRRFFFPRATPARTSTVHIDAWAESARRLTVPPHAGGTSQFDDADDDTPDDTDDPRGPRSQA